MRSGYLPDDIFDETGVEPREQSLWTTWTAARGSLVTDPRFPDEKLAYFDPEWNAETLSALQYLPSEKRAPFSDLRRRQRVQPRANQGAGKGGGDSRRA